MKRLLLMSMLVVFALSSTAPCAMASKDAAVAESIKSLEVKELDLGALAAVPAPCQVGNLNPINFAIPGFALPPEEYALIFDPQAGCSNCPIGVQVNNIHIFMRTSVPCDIQLEVGLRTVGSGDPACPESSPDASACLSGVYNVSLPSANVWDIALPIDCPCADPNYLYALTVNYVSSSCLPEPDLITDMFPSTCTSWNDFGSGWLDIVATYGFPGNLSFYADAVCCEPAIPTDDSSWGAIKGLFKN